MNTLYRLRILYHFMIGIVLYCALFLSPVQAETIDCTAITSLPYTINTQGVYCLTGNLSTSIASGNAITIDTNNVIIDMNGYKLGGLAAGDGTETNGIYAFQRKNITIRNGVIRGFYRGVYLHAGGAYSTSQGHVVTDILADQNTHIGISVQGTGNTVRSNTVVDTGGSTVSFQANSIIVNGPSNDILDNKVSTTTGTGTSAAIGLNIASADYSIVMNNRVNEMISASGSGYAIWIALSDNVIARDNTVISADYGLYYLNSTGKYMGNLTDNISTTAFTGGTAVDTNN